MARVICQVVFKPARVTLVWSDGVNFFEPYHLERDAFGQLEQTARAARKRLAEVAGQGGDADAELLNLGRRLHRLIFRLDASDTAAQAALAWWQKAAAEAPSVDFLSNAPGRIPWPLVAEGEQFWGMRYPIGEGKRVSPLLAAPELHAPTILFHLDEPARRGDLAAWVKERDLPAVTNAQGLFDALGERSSDIVCLAAACSEGETLTSERRFGLDELFERIDTAKGNPYPLVILALHGEGRPVEHWECLVAAAGMEAEAVVLPTVPLPASKTQEIGRRLLGGFLEGRVELGEALRRARNDMGVAGLAWSALAPAGLCVNRLEDVAYVSPKRRPLPANPYAPLEPLDRERRMFLAGRADHLLQCAAVFDQPSTKGLLLHGGMATGKTSFLRAGLIPYLEEESIGFLALRDRSEGEGIPEVDLPTLALRAGPDPLGQLCLGLAYFAARPLDFATPVGTTVRLDLPGYLTRLWSDSSTAVRAGGPGAAPGGNADAAAAGAGPAEGARRLYQMAREEPGRFLDIVNEITARLPWELVIVLEQTEDLLQEGSDASKQRRGKAIELLTRLAASSARCRIVLSTRSDLLGRVLALFPSGKDAAVWREFYLPPLTQEGLEEALLLPTATDVIPYAATAPHAEYKFYYDGGVAQQVAAAAFKAAREHQLSALMLLQCVAAALLERMRSRQQDAVRAVNLRLIEPLQDASVRFLDGLLRRERLAAAPVLRLLDQMTTAEGDSLRRNLVPVADLVPTWKGSTQELEGVLERLTQTAPPVVEVQTLLVNGDLENHAGLASDALAQARGRGARLREMSAHGKTRIIDTLWIMIPLAALAAAVSFYFTRQADQTSLAEGLQKQRSAFEEEKKDIVKEIQAFEKRKQREFNEHVYQIRLRRVADALDANDPIEARGQLFALAPVSKDADDVRGVEWYHLWRRLHPERFDLAGHEAPVSGIALSPDGKLIASAGLDGGVKLWDREKLKEIQTIAGEKNAAHALAFLADGKTLAVARADKTIHLYDVKTDKDGTRLDAKPAVLKGHDAAVISLAAAKGLPLASADSGGKVIVWDEAKKEPAQTFSPAGGVRALAYGAGKSLVVMSGAGKVTGFDPASGKESKAAADSGVSKAEALAANDDGSLTAVGGGKGRGGLVAILDGAGKTVASVELSSPARALAWIRGQNVLAIGTRDHAVHLYDRDQGKVTRTLRSHLGWVNALAAGPDGWFISGGADTRLKVWSVDFEPDAVQAHTGPVSALAFLFRGKVLVSGGEKGGLRFWTPSSGTPVAKIDKAGQGVAALAVRQAKDKATVAVGWSDGKGGGAVTEIEVSYDEKKGASVKEKGALSGLTKTATALAYSTDGKALLVAAGPGRVAKWDTQKNALEKEIATEAKGVLTAMRSIDKSTLILAGSSEGEIVALDAAAGSVLSVKTGSKGAIRGLADVAESNPVQPVFLAWGEDQVLRLWSLAKGKELNEVDAWRRAGFAPNCNLARSDKGQLVFGLGVQGALLAQLDLRMRDLQDRMAFTGGHSATRAVAATPDERVIVAGDEDGTLRFWRAATPEETLNPRPR